MTIGQYEELDHAALLTQYGPWAVIAGASDGTGAGYARKLAAAGLNIMLVARRAEALATVAQELEQRFGISTRRLALDLMSVDAGERILEAAADLDVGLYVSNAGADGGGSAYLNSPVQRWHNVINMNVRNVTTTAYGFGNRMAARKRGGLLLMSSLAALGGQPWLAMYSATKAFEMVLAEALWAELGDSGIDVLSVLAPAMTTPTFHRGVAGTDFDISTAFDPEFVVAEALAHLPHGPLLIFPDSPQGESTAALTATRRERVEMMAHIGKSLFQKS